MRFFGLASLAAFFDGFDEMLVSTEAIFTIGGVFEKKGFERLESESHVAAEENEEAEAGKVLQKVGDVWEVENTIERELSENNSDVEETDVYDENGFLGKEAIKVKDGRDGDGNNEEAGELGEEVVGV